MCTKQHQACTKKHQACITISTRACHVSAASYEHLYSINFNKHIHIKTKKRLFRSSRQNVGTNRHHTQPFRSHSRSPWPAGLQPSRHGLSTHRLHDRVPYHTGVGLPGSHGRAPSHGPTADSSYSLPGSHGRVPSSGLPGSHGRVSVQVG
jgi:hypothetical protein